MAKRNIEKYLNEDTKDLKKWMTIIRPWLACKWIEEFQTFPPNGVNEMIYHININEGMKDTISSMIRARVNGKEVPNPIVRNFEDYIRNDLLIMNGTLENLHMDDSFQWGHINETFITILEDVWGMHLYGKER
jgi:uncharacterized protein